MIFDNDRKEINYVIDIKLINFFNKSIHDASIILPSNKTDYTKIDLLVISGGNTLTRFSKKIGDFERYNSNLRILKKCLKLNIKILGICYGAQLIANYFKGNFSHTKKHVGKHKIFNTKRNQTLVVNSYHNYKITKISNEFEILYRSLDDSIESFISKKKNVMGIMWHPERYEQFKKFDKDMMDLLCN